MKAYKCLRPNKKDCEWLDKQILSGSYCTILSKDKPCIEEEVLMEKIEQLKPEGREKVKWITEMIDGLTAYLDKAPNTDIMDRVNDACGHLRKTRIHLKQYYHLNDE
jgi:hypothetical protein